MAYGNTDGLVSSFGYSPCLSGNRKVGVAIFNSKSPSGKLIRKVELILDVQRAHSLAERDFRGKCYKLYGIH